MIDDEIADALYNGARIGVGPTQYFLWPNLEDDSDEPVVVRDTFGEEMWLSYVVLPQG